MDAIAAQKAGMSYGKYKAIHPGTYLTSVEIVPPEPPKPCPLLRVCARCGELFEITSPKNRQRYCSPDCAAASAKERDAELRRKKRADARAKTRKVCAICGKEFTPDKKHRTTCGPECKAEAVKRAAEKHRAKKA